VIKPAAAYSVDVEAAQSITVGAPFHAEISPSK
jgi:hypothetical protein